MKRALGGGFFSNGRFESDESRDFFLEVHVSAGKMLSFSTEISPQVKTWMNEAFEANSDLVDSLDQMTLDILSRNETFDDTSLGLTWFLNMSTYLRDSMHLQSSKEELLSFRIV